MSYKIGYIDEDSNQFKLYRRKLRDYGFEIIGYEFTKGMSVDELMKQVYDSEIDLLMIDFRLNESNILSFNGEQVEKHIYENKPLFPHIIFTNKVDQAEPVVDDLKIIVDKEEVFPDDDNELKIQRFITLLTKSIEQYKNYVQVRKDVIADLIYKEEYKGLSEVEKDILLSTQQELSNLDKTRLKAVPEQLTSTTVLNKVAAARYAAEQYLDSLLKNDKENES